MPFMPKSCLTTPHSKAYKVKTPRTYKNPPEKAQIKEKKHEEIKLNFKMMLNIN